MAYKTKNSIAPNKMMSRYGRMMGQKSRARRSDAGRVRTRKIK
jgi:hypothetical protein